jgi:hypothetical protein
MARGASCQYLQVFFNFGSHSDELIFQASD